MNLSLLDLLLLKFFSAMFVDIGDNHSVVDRVKLCYIYDDIDSAEVRIIYFITFLNRWGVSSNWLSGCLAYSSISSIIIVNHSMILINIVSDKFRYVYFIQIHVYNKFFLYKIRFFIIKVNLFISLWKGVKVNIFSLANFWRTMTYHQFVQDHVWFISLSVVSVASVTTSYHEITSYFSLNVWENVFKRKEVRWNPRV